jgi:hypothetical protein
MSLHGKRSWGQSPPPHPHFEKLRVANLIYPPLNLRAINPLCYFSMETYIVQLAKDIRMFG